MEKSINFTKLLKLFFIFCVSFLLLLVLQKDSLCYTEQELSNVTFTTIPDYMIDDISSNSYFTNGYTNYIIGKNDSSPYKVILFKNPNNYDAYISIQNGYYQVYFSSAIEYVELKYYNDEHTLLRMNSGTSTGGWWLFNFSLTDMFFYCTQDVYTNNTYTNKFYNYLAPIQYNNISFVSASSDLNGLATGVNDNFKIQILDCDLTAFDETALWLNFYVLNTTNNTNYYFYYIYSYNIILNERFNDNFTISNIDTDYFIYLNSDNLTDLGFFPKSGETIYCILTYQPFYIQPGNITVNGTYYKSGKLSTTTALDNFEQFTTDTYYIDYTKVVIGSLNDAQIINNNVNNGFTDLNNTLNNSDVNNSSFSDISNLNSGFNITDNTGIDGLFLKLYNAFCSDDISNFSITLPFVNYTITIDANFKNNYPAIFTTFINLNVWGFCGLFVLKDIRSIINKVAEGDAEYVGSDIKKEVL